MRWFVQVYAKWVSAACGPRSMRFYLYCRRKARCSSSLAAALRISLWSGCIAPIWAHGRFGLQTQVNASLTRESCVNYQFICGFILSAVSTAWVFHGCVTKRADLSGGSATCACFAAPKSDGPAVVKKTECSQANTVNFGWAWNS